MFPILRGASGGEARSLPLFPLSTVLFPGGRLPLRVFEQRYIEMTTACLRDERPFGVCLITQGAEVASKHAGALHFANIGTLARIVNVDMPQMGILHVMTEGGARFSVRAHRTDAAGLVVADIVGIADEPRQALAEAQAPLARILELIAARIGPANFPAQAQYDDATWVGYRLAELLPLPLSIKQDMLEINDSQGRLATLRQFLERQGLLDRA